MKAMFPFLQDILFAHIWNRLISDCAAELPIAKYINIVHTYVQIYVFMYLSMYACDIMHMPKAHIEQFWKFV